MTISERRTKVRRERILEFAKQQIQRYFEARVDYMNEKNLIKKEEKYNTYVRLRNEHFMFRYGVAMADPYAKWQNKFCKIYEEVEEEFKENGKEKAST